MEAFLQIVRAKHFKRTKCRVCHYQQFTKTIMHNFRNILNFSKTNQFTLSSVIKFLSKNFTISPFIPYGICAQDKLNLCKYMRRPGEWQVNPTVLCGHFRNRLKHVCPFVCLNIFAFSMRLIFEVSFLKIGTRICFVPRMKAFENGLNPAATAITPHKKTNSEKNVI